MGTATKRNKNRPGIDLIITKRFSEINVTEEVSRKVNFYNFKWLIVLFSSPLLSLLRIYNILISFFALNILQNQIFFLLLES